MSKIIYPNYHKSILSIIGSIKKYYNEEYGYTSNQYLDNILKDNKIKHIVFIILDGLGTKVLENNMPNGTMALNKVDDLISIYPSTTAAATTSAVSGLTPIESGWTGWENYIKDINKYVVLFTGNDYYTAEPTGVSGYTYLPYDYFWKDFEGFNSTIMPSFSPNGVKHFKDGLKRINKIIKKHSRSFTYFYWDEPDHLMHGYGSNCKESRQVIELIDKNLSVFSKNMKEDTLVIISADHGHIDVEPIDLYADKKLYSMLKRYPANDSRAMSFLVKEECREEFIQHFNNLYKDYYKLYETKEMIEKGYFGDLNVSKINPKVYDFLGDFFAVAISNKYFTYTPNNDFIIKSHHAGMTEEEMIIPLICLQKK